ncbi:MAG: DUF349 domain-containing protein [Glaciimonas sp.]|nr:DUF349 domain-containing protein [Glaciimonas sp.]
MPINARAQQENARQAALVQAGALDGQETAAVEFILQCGFADARLIAAAHINSQSLQEQVRSAMRNTDRRVARLMQGKIEAGMQLAQCEQRAQQCLEQARRLVVDPQLMPNQVADLDRVWAAIQVPVGQTRQKFETVRAALHSRLACQVELQRALIDALARLREVTSALDGVPSDVGVCAGIIDELALTLEQHVAAPEVPALPKHLLSSFLQEMDIARQKLAVQQRQSVLSASATNEIRTSSGAAPAANDESDLGADFQDAAQAALTAMPVMTAAKIAIPDLTATPQVAMDSITIAQLQELTQRFAEALDGMEKALEQGLLQVACEHDKALRAIDAKLCKPSAAQVPRLTMARMELAHLMSWARWGGNVSREELLKTAEELPLQKLQLAELGKKIGSLRERWKSLDVSAGVSSRELWHRFDAACNSAYEPVAAHFRELAEERLQNAVKAQVLLGQLSSLSVASQDAVEIDWKGVAQQCQRMQQAWQRLGTIERKEKKRLDAEFATALSVLADPLARQRAAAIERRERLIADASEIRADDRTAPEALRALQASWQEQSLFLPLERRDEQALWMRFRAACDAVFAKRKETAQAAEVDRHQNLQQKEAICAGLEAAAVVSPAALGTMGKALREFQNGWSQTGYVPRAVEQQLIQRFDAAVAVLQQRIDALKRAAQTSEIDALQRKLSLCQAVEVAIAQVPQPQLDKGWSAEWSEQAPLAAYLERALQMRFSAALAALAASDITYAATLIDNRAQLGQELLRLEILLGCDSPAELSRERLQMQVEVLQSSLRAGQKQITQQEQLVTLCALPAATDAKSTQRIADLLQKMKSGD